MQTRAKGSDTWPDSAIILYIITPGQEDQIRPNCDRFDCHTVSCPCHQDRNLLRHGTIRRLNLRQLLIRSPLSHFADPAVHHHPLGSRIATCDGGKSGPRNFAIHMWARVGPPHRQRGQIPMSPLVDFHSPSVQVCRTKRYGAHGKAPGRRYNAASRPTAATRPGGRPSPAFGLTTASPLS
jgi:hypothetical protein